MGAGTLKCVAGYNHHGKQNELVNKGLVRSRCPRCKGDENWKYVILCDGIKSLKEKYLRELRESLGKIIKTEQEREVADLITSNIKTYLY